MRAAILNEIIEAAALLDAEPAVVRQFQRMVRRIGAHHSVVGMAHAEQLDFAVRLLSAGVSRPTVRERLMAINGISRSQAYIVINEALHILSRKDNFDWTK